MQADQAEKAYEAALIKFNQFEKLPTADKEQLPRAMLHSFMRMGAIINTELGYLLQWSSQDHTKAIMLFTKAEQILTQNAIDDAIDDKSVLIPTKNNRAYSYLQLAMYDKAIGDFEEALAMYDKAIGDFEEALSLSGGKDHYTCCYLAKVYLEKFKQTQQREFLKKAIDAIIIALALRPYYEKALKYFGEIKTEAITQGMEVAEIDVARKTRIIELKRKAQGE